MTHFTLIKVRIVSSFSNNYFPSHLPHLELALSRNISQTSFSFFNSFHSFTASFTHFHDTFSLFFSRSFSLCLQKQLLIMRNCLINFVILLEFILIYCSRSSIWGLCTLSSVINVFERTYRDLIGDD